MIFVYQGTPDQGPLFFDKLFGDAQAIADPDGKLYTAFDIERGGFRQMFGAKAWACGLKAVGQGHFINRKIGDPWTLPTVLAVRDQTIVWVHRGDHAGHHPDLRAIPTLMEAVTS